MKLKIIQPYHQSNVKLFGKAYMSMLTLPVLASLCPPDIDVSIADENVEDINFDENIDVACITTLTCGASRTYQIADRFRKKGVKVILGGIHPTMMPKEAAKHADTVVLGEAEPVWDELITDLRNGGLKKFYQCHDKPDLVHAPLPRHELTNKKAYVNIPKVETSRGCPFKCNFCSTTRFFGNKMRYRPVEQVIKEIKSIGDNFVFFTDNNIVGNPKYAKRLFKELIPLGIKWISQGSLNLAKDLELLTLAAKSGCVGMLVGFESLTEKAIQAVGKTVNKVQEYAKQIKTIHKAGITLIGCFVLGFDEDDPNIFKQTLKFIKKMNIEVPQLTILTPFPGTDLRDTLEKEGRIIHNDWSKYDATHVTFQPKNMSSIELRKKYDKLCRKAYSYRAITRRIIGSLFRHQSFYKALVVWQCNVVYRRLWKVTVGDDAGLA